ASFPSWARQRVRSGAHSNPDRAEGKGSPMDEPIASRPHMPGYDIAGEGEGTLLPWSWAEERLVKSHDYWLTTVRPDGRPHVMPVWGVWLDRTLWWSSSRGSRK